MPGGIKVNENWRKRYNKELMPLFEVLDTFHLSEKVSYIGLVMLTEWIVEEILREID